MNNTITLTNESAYIQVALYSKLEGLAFDCHSASVVVGGFVCGGEDLLLSHRDSGVRNGALEGSL